MAEAMGMYRIPLIQQHCLFYADKMVFSSAQTVSIPTSHNHQRHLKHMLYSVQSFITVFVRMNFKLVDYESKVRKFWLVLMSSKDRLRVKPQFEKRKNIGGKFNIKRYFLSCFAFILLLEIFCCFFLGQPYLTVFRHFCFPHLQDCHSAHLSKQRYSPLSQGLHYMKTLNVNRQSSSN